jgi:hypothetical protein
VGYESVRPIQGLYWNLWPDNTHRSAVELPYR